MPSEPCLELVDRLRGIYALPVNDGLGLLDGSDVFKRAFETSPLHHEAAQVIERLQAGEDIDTYDLVLRLSQPVDPHEMGKLYVLPIFNEAIRAIAELQVGMRKE